MARIEPDTVIGRSAPLLDGETVVAEFRADRLTYWRSHLIMAVVLGTAAGLFLVWQGNPYPVAGPFGAAIAIAARAAYLASEAAPFAFSPARAARIRPVVADALARLAALAPDLKG